MAERMAKPAATITVELQARLRTASTAKYRAAVMPLMSPPFWPLRRRAMGRATSQPRAYTAQMGQNRAMFFFHRAG